MLSVVAVLSDTDHDEGPARLLDLFLAASDGERSGQGLGEALARLWTEARQAWPELDLGVEVFIEYVATRVETDAELPAAIERLRPGDLLLCCACLRGDAVAMEAFEIEYLGHVPAAARRLGLSSTESQDVQQSVRQRLLMGTGGKAPRLARYSGRGDLRNWVRTVALRTGQNLVAARAREPTRCDGLERAVEPGPAPDLAVLRHRYGDLFRRAFEEAVAALSPRERTLLRLAFVEGMTSDGLAAVYGIHRATAARRVASARDRLSARIRRSMMLQLGVGRADLQSIFRLLQSQLDVSVRRCLSE